jgi:hypothetical protein
MRRKRGRCVRPIAAFIDALAERNGRVHRPQSNLDRPEPWLDMSQRRGAQPAKALERTALQIVNCLGFAGRV